MIKNNSCEYYTHKIQLLWLWPIILNGQSDKYI